MPATTSTRNRPYDYYEDYDKGFKLVYSNQPQTETCGSRTWPGSTYREKPKLLSLGNGTARSIQSMVSRDSAFTVDYSFYPRRRMQGRLVDLVYYHKSGVSEPGQYINREALYNSLRKKLRHNATNLAMNFAEYRQTASLYRDLASAVATKGRTLVSARPDVLHPFKDWKRGTSRAYLQYQYGVAPLVGDMTSALTEMSNILVDRPIVMSGRESRKVHTQVNGIVADPADGSHKALRVIDKTTRFTTHWEARMNNNIIRNSLAAHGFLNPFALAWELIPYSFVIDWWVNVGDVLSSLDNLLLVDSLTVQNSSSEKTAFTTEVIAKGGLNAQTGGSSFFFYRNDTRDTPFQITEVSSLQYKPSLSLKHIANGLALLHQAAGRRTPFNIPFIERISK